MSLLDIVPLHKVCEWGVCQRHQEAPWKSTKILLVSNNPEKEPFGREKVCAAFKADWAIIRSFIYRLQEFSCFPLSSYIFLSFFNASLMGRIKGKETNDKWLNLSLCFCVSVITHVQIPHLLPILLSPAALKPCRSTTDCQIAPSTTNGFIFILKWVITSNGVIL